MRMFAFDVETTGLSALTDFITEIGCCQFNESGEILSSFQSFIKIPIPVPANIIELTGITDEMLAQAPDRKTALNSFFDYLGDSHDCYLVAHNNAFDCGFIREACRKEEINPKPYKCYCSMQLARMNMYNNKYPLLSMMKGRINLPSLSKALGISLAVSHRALADAETAAKAWCLLDGPKVYSHAMVGTVIY